MIITDNNNSIDKSAFSYALGIYRSEKNSDSRESGSAGNRIGTLGEKSLHSVLKWYYEPDGNRHETAVGDYVADIVGEDGIIEIQTRGLSKLKPKLAELLASCRVTVVHPVIVSRRIISFDSETGEVISVRKSPRRGSVYSEMREIYTLRDYLTEENLTLRLPHLTADEYRTFGVKTNRRKKQRTRKGEYVSDIVPTDILGEITLSGPSGFSALIPSGLPEEFTSADFAEAAGTDTSKARMAINLLIRAGFAENAGKSGKKLLYRLTDCQ